MGTWVIQCIPHLPNVPRGKMLRFKSVFSLKLHNPRALPCQCTFQCENEQKVHGSVMVAKSY